ncbi:MAG: hypothetical protein CVU65_16255 [Deltaproteobacteria bacterium HGW-Deltaproteobacteria-22]|nr:MAG: hypothetical protein CVU65_16255 [Deltaproteobacteria bacterium HGW-Deltaproteobacteria-22]
MTGLRAILPFLVLQAGLLSACSTAPETEPRVFVRYATVPVTYGRTVQTLFALRLVKAHSDPLQSSQLAIAAHLASTWFSLPPFDEASGEEEAYLRRFCRIAGWDTPSTPACFEKICRTVLDQLETVLLEFREVPTYEAGVEELLLDLEALKVELEFPPLAILALGERRPELVRAQRRRLPPGLPVFVSEEHFRVFESTDITWTQLDRIREIFDRASRLEEPAALSVFAGTGEKTSQVLFALSLARQAGVNRVWAWGRQDGLAGAVELLLVPENPGQEDPAALDVSGFATWGAALAAISGHATGADPVAVRVGALPVPDTAAAELPVVPALEQLRHKLTQPEP